MRQLLKRGLRALPIKYRYEMFYQLARSLGLRGYAVQGSQGTFVGAASDRTIMRAYLREQAWALDIVPALSAALADGGTLIDVGANIGIVALSVARLPGVEVIALEPDEENHGFLRANIGLHGVRNVQPIKAAAWRSETTLRFARNTDNSGDHHVADAGEYVVQAVTLDQLAVSPGPLVLKIDTQGAEPAVLQGASTLLQRADLVVIEFWPWGMRRMGEDPQVAIDILCGLQRTSRLVHDGEHGPWLDSAGLRAGLTRELAHAHEYRSLDVVLSRQSLSYPTAKTVASYGGAAWLWKEPDRA